MATGFTAMALGTVTYFIPFFFVMDNALLLDGDPGVILRSVIEVLVGTVIIAAAIQNYLPYLPQFLSGPLRGGIAMRATLAASGLLIALPSLHVIGLDFSNRRSLTSGVVLLALVFLWQVIHKKMRQQT